MSLRDTSPLRLCTSVLNGVLPIVASAAGLASALAFGAAADPAFGFGLAVGRLEVSLGTPPELEPAGVCECSSLKTVVSPLPYWVSLLVICEASTSTAI